MLLASEGININICGKKDRIKESISFINKVIDIKNIHINQSMIKEMAFKRLKVKIKKEIIKIGFNIDKKFIEKSIRLKPEDWHRLLDEDITLLDIRNKFEHALGTFENAIGLDLLNFNDLQTSQDQLKIKKIKLQYSVQAE